MDDSPNIGDYHNMSHAGDVSSSKIVDNWEKMGNSPKYKVLHEQHKYSTFGELLFEHWKLDVYKLRISYKLLTTKLYPLEKNLNSLLINYNKLN